MSNKLPWYSWPSFHSHYGQSCAARPIPAPPSQPLTMLKWIPESPPQNRKCCCHPRYSNSLRSPAPGPGRAMTSKHLFSHLTTTPLDVFPSGSKGSLSKITTSIADLGSGSAFWENPGWDASPREGRREFQESSKGRESWCDHLAQDHCWITLSVSALPLQYSCLGTPMEGGIW